VVFLQGGASLQFAMVPLNFLPATATADYILTGAWSERARDEAAGLGVVHIAASTQEEGYRRIPRPHEVRLSAAPAYVHLTSNNTIYGTQWHWWPEVGDRPLVADMSSDICSRPFDARAFALIYAGAQKNLGPAGVTVVLLRESWLERAARNVPVALRYATYVKHNSLYNTPPVFAVYLLNLVLAWIEQMGGLEAMQQHNQTKAQAVYAAIDGSGGFYRGHAAPDSRSLMNVTFRLPDEGLEKQFLAEAAAERRDVASLIGLAGHRSVGGVRASLYNALSLEACEALAAFMGEFAHAHG
jgi:phosphoserine aminotransferase